MHEPRVLSAGASSLRTRRNELRKLLRFSFIGILNTAFHAAVLSLAITGLGLAYGLSNVIAYGVVSLASFALNARFSFRMRGTRARFARFQLVGLLNVFLCYGLGVFAEAYRLHFGYLVFVTALALPLVTFTFHNRYTFR